MLYRFSCLRTFFALSFISLFLHGCSQKFQDSTSTVAEAFNNLKDVQIPPEQIAKLPYASMFLRIDDSRQLFLILGFDEFDKNTGQRRLTWLSSDKSRIITENGRIVYTTGFSKDNLVGLFSPTAIPPVGLTNSWPVTYDWMPGYRYQFSGNLSSYVIGDETLSNDSWTKQTQHIVESVSFPSLDSSIYNNYWVETIDQDGETRNQVVKSIQYLGPDMHKVEFTMVKPYIPPTSHKEMP